MLKTIMTGEGTFSEKVSKILRECNIYPHLLGFVFLKESIIQVQLGTCKVQGITKTLYPIVSKVYGSSPSRVERAMRHAISYAWERAKSEPSVILESLFKYSARTSHVPTNSEFIATLADAITGHTAGHI